MTSRIMGAKARTYGDWSITVHIYGSAFDHVSGDLRQVDQDASEVQLNRIRTNSLLGAFPGAAVVLTSHREEAGLTSIAVSGPESTEPEDRSGGFTSDAIGTRAQLLLEQVYQRMDWFVEKQSLPASPPPAAGEKPTVTDTPAPSGMRQAFWGGKRQ